MTQQTETTPFGRRSVLLCQIAAQTQAGRALEAAAKPGANQPAAVNKWTLSRTLAEIKDRLGVSDRSFSVLNALLSFQPETALSLHAQNDGEDAEGQVLRAEGTDALNAVVNGSPAIKSPGGYLRALTEKARAGEFAAGPIRWR